MRFYQELTLRSRRSYDTMWSKANASICPSSLKTDRDPGNVITRVEYEAYPGLPCTPDLLRP
jgi:hypothetical protein